MLLPGFTTCQGFTILFVRFTPVTNEGFQHHVILLMIEKPLNASEL